MSVLGCTACARQPWLAPCDKCRPPIHAAVDCPKRIEVTSWGDWGNTYIHGDCMTDLTRRRIYLAGPMTGLPEFNYPAFNDAAFLLREDKRNIVINPAENYGGNTEHERWRYIDKSVDQIQALAKVLYSTDDDCMVITLDGWADSAGARLEVDLAYQLGLPVYELNCVFDPHWDEECRIVPGGWPTHAQDDSNEALQKAAALAKETISTAPVRAQVLAEASKLICGDRNNQYGPPGKDFNRTANMLTALGFGKENAVGELDVLSDHDVAVIMIALKLSRIMWSPEKRDSWVDVAGYAGCGAEVARAE